MSTVYSAAYTTLVRDQLQDASGGTEIWSDEEIADHVIRAIKDVSQYRPYLQESVLSVTNARKTVDISSLSDMVWIDRRVEFYVDLDVTRWRNWEWAGREKIKMDIDFNASASDTLLTGTVTFAASTAVTGSGTAFTTEAPAGSYIKHSDDTEWYEVLSVTDDTNLILRESYGGTTGADTANTSPMRTNKQVARIFWGSMHTVTTTASTLPTELEQLVVDGGYAYALRGYTKRAREVLNSAVGIISTMDTALDLAAAEVTLMVADVALARENKEAQKAAAETAIGKVAARIAAIETLILAADDNVAAMTVAPEMARYVQLMNAQYQQAMGYLQEFKAQVSEGGTLIAEDLANATGEANAIVAILNHGKSYGDECLTYLRSGEAMLRHSIALADRQEAVFREGLKRAQGRQRRTPKNSLLSREA